MCVGCQHKKRCPKCWRFLPPHLFYDEDGDWGNACIRKSSQTGGATVYRSFKDTLEEHVLDGSDDQTSIEFFLHSNDADIRRILAHVIRTHTYVLKFVSYTLITLRCVCCKFITIILTKFNTCYKLYIYIYIYIYILFS